jgi:hypothetical protein
LQRSDVSLDRADLVQHELAAPYAVGFDGPVQRLETGLGGL